MRISLKGQIYVTKHKGVYKISNCEKRNDQQPPIDRLAKSNHPEFFFLGEGGAIDFLSILYFLIYIDLSVGILHM
jgi:hypothetical protein